MAQLTWSSQSDWDAAQSREGVVTRAIGDRVGDEIWQGYDPNYAPLDDAVAYWTMDDSGSTVTDAISTHDGSVNGPVADATGTLSSTAYDFDELNDNVTVSSMPLPSPESDWTANMWVHPDFGSIFRVFFVIEDTVADESLGLGIWDDDNSKIYSDGRTPGTGAQYPLNEWSMATLTWDSSASTASMYVNGSFDYDVSPSGGVSISGADQITLGNRRNDDVALSGRLDEVILFDRELSSSEISALYDVGTSGSLTTGTKNTTGEATTLDTSAVVSASTNIDITVHQDTGGTTNQETVTVGNGSNSYTLTAFNDASSDYWLEIDTSTSDITESPKLDSAELTVEASSTPQQITATATDIDASTSSVSHTSPASASVTWNSPSDWDAAQTRERVISRNIGVRASDEVALGFDPNYGVVSTAVEYWTLDESSGDLDDVIAGRTATTTGVTYGSTGPVGTNALTFDGTGDYAETTDDSDPTGGGDFSIMAWVDKDAVSDVDTIYRSGTSVGGTFFFDYRADDRIGFGFYDSTETEQYHTTFHQGTSMLGEHLLVGTYDSTADELTVFLDGSPDTKAVGDSRPANTSQPANIGRSPVSGGSRFFDGDIGTIILWDYELSQTDVDELVDTLSSGALTTGKKAVSGGAVELATTASVPTNTSLDIIVHQDTGSTTNQETVSIDNGTNTYPLSGFEDTSSDYWIEADFATTDETRSSTVDSVTIDISTSEPVVRELTATAADPDAATADMSSSTAHELVATASDPDGATSKVDDGSSGAGVQLLEWSTNADWTAAQSRAGVVTSAVGVRQADEVWQGFDPSTPLLADAIAYWTMDQQGTDAFDSIGNFDMTVDGASTVSGILSSRGLDCDGDNDVVYVPASDTSDTGDEGALFYAFKDVDPGQSSTNWYFSHPDTNERLYNGTFGGETEFRVRFSTNSWRGTGWTVPVDEWHTVCTVWDHGSWEFYADGTLQDSGTYNGSLNIGTEEWVFGGWSPGGSYTTMTVSDALLFTEPLTSTQVSDLDATLSSGSLTTATKTADAAATDVTIDAVVPTGTSASATIHQQTDTTTNQETVQLTDGTNTYPLVEFANDPSDYWVELDLSTTDPEATAKIDSVVLSTGEEHEHLFVASVPIGDANTVVDIPVYELSSVDPNAIRFRDDVTGDVGAAKVIDHSVAQAVMRHPVHGKIGLETIDR